MPRKFTIIYLLRFYSFALGHRHGFRMEECSVFQAKNGNCKMCAYSWNVFNETKQKAYFSSVSFFMLTISTFASQLMIQFCQILLRDFCVIQIKRWWSVQYVIFNIAFQSTYHEGRCRLEKNEISMLKIA